MVCDVHDKLAFKLSNVFLVVSCCYFMWVFFPSYEDICVFVQVVVAPSASELIGHDVTNVF